MAISGSTDFVLDRDGIINKALSLVGVKEANLSPAAYEVTEASEWLNLLLKSWMADNTHLWVRTTGTIFLEKGKQSYNLGTGTYAARGTITETTTTAAHVSTDTVIAVTDTTGMTAADNVGILLDDDTIHWDTIVSVDSGIQITITTGLASASSSGDAVSSFTNVAHRPLRIQEMALRDTSDNDTDIDPISQQEYWERSSKTSAGFPTEFFYDPQLTDGVLYPWAVMNKNGYKLVYRYDKPFDDLDAATDDLEFPIEWALAIIYNLALDLANSYAISDEMYNRILRRSTFLLKKAKEFDVENTSVEFEPEQGH